MASFERKGRFLRCDLLSRCTESSVITVVSCLGAQNKPFTTVVSSTGLPLLMIRSQDILVLPSALEVAKQGDVDKLQHLLDDVTDLDVLNEVLYECAKHGREECARTLLRKGADPAFWQPSDDETALSVTCSKGHLQTAELFLSQGTNANVRCNGDMHTALHSSCANRHLACVSLLLRYKADLDIKDCFATTPLMKACRSGHTDVVKLLLDNGANATVTNLKKLNAFILALSKCESGCVRELLKARPEFSTERTPEGLLPLTHAIRFRDTQLVQAFVDAGCDLNTREGLLLTPLQLAIETGHIPTIKALVQGGCNVDGPLGLPTGSTPLMLAVCKGRADIVEALLESGCATDQFDRHGRTALHLAVKHGFLQCVHKLLKAGADPDCSMFDEMQPEVSSSHNPLHTAVLNDQPEETLALIQSGCDLFQSVVCEDAQRHGAFTAFQCALGRESKWAVKVLVYTDPSVICNVHPYTGTDEEIIFALEVAQELNLKPKTLKTQTRNFIRRHLGGKGLFAKVPLLSLPLPLADYLLFKDLEEFI